jgi:hypothetical protein
MQDPSGRVQLVHPCLFSYVVDDPEGKDVTCIKGSNSNHPCELCWVNRGELDDMRCTISFPLRTECQQVRLCTVPVCGSIRDARAAWAPRICME